MQVIRYISDRYDFLGFAIIQLCEVKQSHGCIQVLCCAFLRALTIGESIEALCTIFQIREHEFQAKLVILVSQSLQLIELCGREVLLAVESNEQDGWCLSLSEVFPKEFERVESLYEEHWR